MASAYGFEDPDAEARLHDELDRRRVRMDGYRRQVRQDPDLARRTVRHARYSPWVKPGVAAGLASAGLEPEDPQAQVVSRRAAEVAADQGVGYNPPGTKVNASWFSRNIGRPLKAVARGVFTALETPYQELVARPLTAAATTALEGGGFMENYNETAPSSGLLALEAMSQDRPVDLGDGILPAGQIREYREAQKQNLKIDGEFATPGRAVPAVVNRLFNAEVVEPGTGGYNALSGTVDALLNIFADPANLAAGGAAKVVKGRRVFGATEAVAPRTQLLIEAGGVEGLRRSTLQDVAEQWLDTNRGAQRLADRLAETPEFDDVWKLLGGDKGKIDRKTALAIADARTSGQVKDVLRPLLGVQIREKPGTGFFHLSDVGGKVRLAKERVRLFNDMPDTQISGDNMEDALRSIDLYQKNAKLDAATIARNNRAVAELDDGDHVGLFNVTKQVMDDIGRSLGERGVQNPLTRRLTKMYDEANEDLRAYWVDDVGGDSAFPGVRLRTLNDGEVQTLPTPGILTEYIHRKIPLPNVREIRQQASVFRRLFDVPGVAPTVNTLSAGMSDLWKPLQLARLAYPVRVLSEEQARMGAAGLDSAFAHPLSYISYMVGRKGAGAVDDITEAEDFLGALNRGSAGWRGDLPGTVFTGDFVRVTREDPDFVRGWSENISKMLNEPVMQRVALGGLKEGDRIPSRVRPQESGPHMLRRAEFEATGEDLLHGTGRAFDRFDSSVARSRTGKAATRRGRFYFTDRDDIARTFAEYTGSADATLTDFVTSGRFNRAAAREAMGEHADALEDFLEDAPSALFGGLDGFPAEALEAFRSAVRVQFRDVMKRQLDRGWTITHLGERITNADDPRLLDAVFDEGALQLRPPGVEPRVINTKVYGKTLDLSTAEARAALPPEVREALEADFTLRPSLEGRPNFQHEHSEQLTDIMRRFGYGKVKVPDVGESGGRSIIALEEMIGYGRDVHREAVESAIRRGVEVPEEVLADYADISQGPDAAFSGMDAVKEWFWRGTGQRFRKQLAERDGELADGRSFRDAMLNDRAFADSYIDDHYFKRLQHITGGDSDLRDIIATGKWQGTNLLGLEGDHKALRKVLDGKVDAAPEFVSASRSLRVTGRQGDRMQRWDRYDKAVERMFEHLMSKPTNRLSRSVAWKQFYWTRMRELTPFMDDATRQALGDAAKGAGMDSRWFREFELAKRGGVGDRITALDEADMVAKAFALDKTKGLLYDLSKRGQFADVTRLIFPFAEAWKEIGTTWINLATSRPQILRRGQQLVEGARGSGFFYTDPQTGEEVFAYPGSGLISRWMLGTEDGFGYTFTGNVQGVNLFAGSLMPGFGPLVQIPAAGLIPHSPTWETVREMVLPFGDPDMSMGIESAFAPAWLRKLGTAWFGNPDADRAYANSVMDVAKALVADGNYSTNSPADIRDLLNVARKEARHLWLIRGVAQAVLPTGPRPTWYTKDASGRSIAVVTMADEYRKMVTEYGDEAAATEAFLERFGYGNLFSVQGKSVALAERSMTKSGADWEQANPQQVEAFPNTIGLFTPEGLEDEFDFAAWERSFEEGNREQLTPDEFVALSNDLKGRVAYEQARRSVADRITEPAVIEWLRQVKTALREEYPGYDSIRDRLPARASLEDQIAELERAAADPVLAETDAGQGLALYLQARDQAMQAAQAITVNGRSLASFKSAKSAAHIRSWLRQIGAAIAEEHPGFTGMWERVLQREMVDDTEAVEGVA